MGDDNLTKADKLFMQLNELKGRVDAVLFLRKIAINWHDSILFYLKIKPSFLLRLKNGKEVAIKTPQDYKNIEIKRMRFDLVRSENPEAAVRISKDFVRLRFNGKNVTFYYDSEEELGNLFDFIGYNFLIEQSKLLNVSGKQVLDIGANMGDTAIMFALKDAEHVYALEPYRLLYDQAKTNVRRNHLQERISLIHGGCGSHKTTIRMDMRDPGGAMKEAKHGDLVQVTTLADLVEKYDISDAFLKMDCEGCEYGIILNATDEVLRKFSQMMIEYHSGYINLERKLKAAGFRVDNTKYKHLLAQRVQIGDKQF